MKISNENEIAIDEEMSEDEYTKKIFDDFRHDYKASVTAKTEIDSLISDWNDIYYGITRNRDGEIIKHKQNKSRASMKEVAKQIEWQKPNVTEPFTSTRTPIHIKAPKSQARARQLAKWANHEFTTEFDREEFIDQVADVVLREGTCWVQTSWETKRLNVRSIIPNASMQEIMQNENDPDEIEQNPDGTFKVEYNIEEMTRNNPDSKVIRNEHAFPDPGARTEDEMRFFCILKYLTITDLEDLGMIDEDKLEHLASMVTSESREDTALGQHRNNDAQSYGYDPNYEPNDDARKYIKVIEYWGYYDIHNDGIQRPVIGYFAEDYKIDLAVEENPFPDKAIPVDRTVYSARPFSLWGNAMAFFLGDHQKAINGITRGIMDNMSLANNGQKFIGRGALDYINFKKLNNGDRYIIVNKPDMIVDGKYNNIPTSVFSTLEMIKQESKELVGVASNGMALNEGAAKNDDPQQLTMSQQRMAALVRNMSNMMRKIIKKWITMGEVFLTDQQIEDLFHGEEMVDMNAFTISSSAKVTISVATEVNRNMKLKQQNMLMQQAKVLEEELPPGTIKDMVAEMMDLFDMHEQATKLRLYKKEPSPEEQMASQMQLQKMQLEIQKLQTEIGVMEKDVEARYMNAQARMMEANANYGYKGAQTREKDAKAQAHSVDTALKPVQVENEIMKAHGQNKMKERNG